MDTKTRNILSVKSCVDKINEALEQLTLLEVMYQGYAGENTSMGRKTLDRILKSIEALEGAGGEDEFQELEPCHLCGAGSTSISYKVVIKHWCPGSVEKFPEGFLVLEKDSIEEAVTEWNKRAKFFKRQARIEKFIDEEVIGLKNKEGGQHDN